MKLFPRSAVKVLAPFLSRRWNIVQRRHCSEAVKKPLVDNNTHVMKEAIPFKETERVASPISLENNAQVITEAKAVKEAVLIPPSKIEYKDGKTWG